MLEEEVWRLGNRNGSNGRWEKQRERKAGFSVEVGSDREEKEGLIGLFRVGV